MARRTERRWWLAVRVVVVAAAVALLAPESRAQFGMNIFGGDPENSAPMTRKGVKQYAQILGLDADQTDALNTLFDGYLTGYKNTAKQMQSAMEALSEKYQESQKWDEFGKEMGKVTKEYMAKFQTMEKGFLDDVKAMLTPAQEGNWAKLERFRRREQLLKVGIVSGQGVDLIDAVRVAGADKGQSPELTEELNGYETEMDRLLVDGEKMAKEMQEKVGDAFSTDGQQEMQKAMTKIMDMAKQVRDVNRKHARRIKPLLPADKQAKFEEEVKRRSFPAVYKKSYPTKILDASLGFKDLEQAQKDSLEAIKTSYARNLAAANEKWASAVEEAEAKADNFWESMYMAGRDPNDPVTKARKERRDLDKETKERILAVLKEEQRARLPEQHPEPDYPWGGVTTDEDSGDDGGE